jgi:hypothetical protein
MALVHGAEAVVFPRAKAINHAHVFEYCPPSAGA